MKSASTAGRRRAAALYALGHRPLRRSLLATLAGAAGVLVVLGLAAASAQTGLQSPAVRMVEPTNTYEDAVQNDAPRAFWRLGEAGGAVAADVSGHGRDGTLVGTFLLGQAGLVQGDANSAIRFRASAGSNGGLMAGGFTGELGNQVTAEAIVDYQSLTSPGLPNRVLSRGWGQTGGWSLSVYRTADEGVRARWAINGQSGEVAAEAEVAPGRLHLAGSYDGTTMRLFVDGAAVASQALPAENLVTTEDIVVGHSLVSDLTIDEAAVYEAAPSAQALATHSEVGAGLPPAVRGVFTARALASDDVELDRVEFFVGDRRVAQVGDGDGDVFSAEIPTLSSRPIYDGLHELTAKAYDSSGHSTVSEPVDVRVANADGTKYQADFASTGVPATMVIDDGVTQPESVHVTVTNRSAHAWAAATTALRARWIGEDRVATSAGPDVALSADVAASEQHTRTIAVSPPYLPAGIADEDYTLQIDLVDTATPATYATQGNRPHEHVITIARKPRVEPGRGPQISGSPQAGATLTAEPGQWHHADDVTRQWQRCNSDGDACQDIPTATDRTYAIQSDDLGRTVRVREIATRTGVSATVASAATRLVSAPPTVNLVEPAAAGGSPPSVRGVFTARALASDDVELDRVEFFVDDRRVAQVADGDAEGFSVEIATLAARPIYDGDHELTAKAYDGSGHSTLSDPVEVRVANTEATKYQAGFSSPNVPTTMVIEGGVTQAEPVNVTVTNRSAHAWAAATTALRARWIGEDGVATSAGADAPLSADVAAGGQQTRAVAITPPDLPAGVADEDYTLQIDLVDTATPTTYAAKGNHPDEHQVTIARKPRLEPGLGPQISGTPQAGATLTADPGQWHDADHVTRQWQRCNADGDTCDDIPNATDDTLILDSADVGSTIRVEELATNNAVSTSAVSQPTAAVAGLVLSLALDDGAGFVAHDTSGQRHNAQVNGAAWTTEGRFDGALQFDGTDDHAVVSQAPVRRASELTVEAWVRPARTDRWAPVVVQSASPAASSWGLYASQPDNGRVRATFGGAFVEGPLLPLDEWSHLAMVVGPGELSLYVNGKESATVERPSEPVAVIADGALRIGADLADDRHFTGLLDDIRMHTVAIDAADMAQDRSALEGAPPVLDVAADLVGAGGGALDQESKNVAVSAEPVDPAGEGAAVVALRVHIDETSILNIREACSTGACSLERTATVAAATLQQGEHELRVEATDAAGRRTEEVIPFAVDHGPPAQVDGVHVSLTRDFWFPDAHIEWDAGLDGDVVGWEVLRRSEEGGEPFVVTAEPVEVPEYDDRFLPPGVSLWFSVRAVDGAGTRGAESDPIRVETDAVLVPPSGITAVGAVGAVELTWSPAPEPVTGYVVYASDEAGGPYVRVSSGGIATTAFRDETASKTRPTYYVVRGVTASGLLTDPTGEASATALYGPTAPQIALSGGLAAAGASGEWLRGPTIHQLTVSATETSDSGSTPGVTRLDIAVDGEVSATVERECPAGGCQLATDWAFVAGQYNDGQHAIDVTATDAAGRAVTETLEVRVDNAPPNPAEGLEANGGNRHVVLQWRGADDGDVAGYIVERAAQPSGPFSPVGDAPADAHEFVDSELTNGTTYSYRLTTRDQAGRTSDPSDPVSARPGGAATAPPRGLEATARPYSILLTWDGVDDATNLLGYNVYRGRSADGPWTRLRRLPADARTLEDTDTDPSERWWYAIGAIDRSGTESPRTTAVSARAAGFDWGRSEGGGGTPIAEPFVWSQTEGQYAFTYEYDGRSHRSFDYRHSWAYSGASGAHRLCGEDCETRGRGMSEVALSPDGKEMLGYRNDNALLLIDTGTGKSVVVCEPTGCNGSPVWTPIFSPDGRRIIGTSYEGIVSITRTGADRKILVPTVEEARPESPTISPDGTLYYALHETPEGGFRPDRITLWKLPSHSDTPRKLQRTFDARTMYSLRISPNGQYIAYVPQAPLDEWNWVPDGVRIAATDGSPGQVVGPANATNAGWSRNSDRLIYAAPGGDHGGTVRSMKVDGTDDRLLYDPSCNWDTDDFCSVTASAEYRGVSGPSVKLTTDPVTNSSRSQKVAVNASDGVDGLRAVGVSVAEETRIHRNDCSDQCPGSTWRTLGVPLGDVSEGRHKITAAAKSAAGPTSTAVAELVVDRTAPVNPPQAELHTLGRRYRLEWAAAADPPLADQSAGSGVKRTSIRYRTRPDQPFSPWIHTTDDFAVIPGTAIVNGSPVQVEFSATDAAGNESAVTAIQAAIQVAPCEPYMRVLDDELVWTDRKGRRHVEEESEVDAFFNLKNCRSEVTTAAFVADFKVLGTEDLWPNSDGSVGFSDTKKVARKGRRAFVGPSWELHCVPGSRRYKMAAFAFVNGGTIRPNAGLGELILNCNNDGVWRYRAHTSWKADPPARIRDPSALLARRIGSPPNLVQRWQAHHIIPAAEQRGGADRVQSRGYACRIDPNEAVNGVWIEQRRHSRLNNNDYYEWLYRDVLQPAMKNRDGTVSRNGACNYDVAKARMAAAKRELAAGRVFADGRNL